MENYLVKRKTYSVIEQVNEYTYKASLDDKVFLVYKFAPKSKSYSDFLYAAKKLSNAGVKTPKIISKDKKQGIIIVEYLDCDTVFDDLRNHDLEDEIYKQAFEINAHAKINRLGLDFNPQNFKYCDGKLYYMAFTFDVYSKALDLSTEKIYHWFYTNKFKNDLINLKLPIDTKRILPEFEGNKKIVLKVVEYYR